MGGMGFIENNKARCMLSVLISTHMLLAAREARRRALLLFILGLHLSSLQADQCRCYRAEGIGRLSGRLRGRLRLGEAVYRAACAATSVRISASRPAWRAITTSMALWNLGWRTRKSAGRGVAQGHDGGHPGKHEIEIWGDGEQTRSFMYIDDCLHGTQMLLHSDVEEPINLGSDEMVTINQLVDIVEEIAGIKLKRHYNLDAPKGVSGRNSDNTLIKAKLGWAPSIPLRVGMEKTYRWIYDQAKAREEGRPYIAAAA